MSYFCDNSFAEDVDSVDVVVDVGDVKMLLSKGHHHLHLLGN